MVRKMCGMVVIGSDRKPKRLPFTRLARLNELTINIVTEQNFFEKKYVLILKDGFLDINTK
jgi:hypothetical protein